MYVQQLYTGCLAEAAYYIDSYREAAVIDPLRDIEPYLKLAAERGATIKYIFETHFHADFVSGHLELARETGATIVYGPNARPAYTAYVAMDKEMFHIGDIRIKTLHTPGHTMESTCYLLIDEDGRDHSVFTGDTLFNGDVGRPDLAVQTDMTREQLAGFLYDSLRRLKNLEDYITVYPAHGAGSPCGKNMNSETVTTIGEQKRHNDALSPMSREEFIEMLIEGLEEPPPYFQENARLNKMGYDHMEEVIQRNLKPLSVADFENEVDHGAAILDTRHPDIFQTGFIPTSLNIGLNGTFALWVGTLLKIEQPLVLVAEPGKEKESVLRLARVGFENVKGFLEGGREAWEKTGKPLEQVEAVAAREMKSWMREGYQVLDVRTKVETLAGHIEGAVLIPLKELTAKLNQLSMEGKYLIHCASGYRSMMASSLLKKQGVMHIKNISGGYTAIQEEERIHLNIAKSFPEEEITN